MYSNLHYLIVIDVIIFFIDCDGMSLYLPFPVIHMCERYLENLKLRLV